MDVRSRHSRRVGRQHHHQHQITVIGPPPAQRKAVHRSQGCREGWTKVRHARQTALRNGAEEPMSSQLDHSPARAFVPTSRYGVPVIDPEQTADWWLQNYGAFHVLIPLMKQRPELRRLVPKDRVFTLRTMQRHPLETDTPILGWHPVIPQLCMLHEHQGPVCVVATTYEWYHRAWINSTNAKNLLTGRAGTYSSTDRLDPVVAAAFADLSRSVDHSVWRPIDESRIKWALLHLPRHGYSVYPEILAEWALCNGFRWHEATMIRLWASLISTDRRARICPRPGFAPDIIDQWRSQATAAAPESGSH